MGAWILLLLFFVLLVVLLTLFYFLLRIGSDFQSWQGGAPFVGVPLEVARQALGLVQLSKGDVFYDLGCGDGRVLKLAIQEFGAKKAVGYEIGFWPYLKFKIQNSKFKIKTPGVKSLRTEIHRENLLNANLSEASVVFLYLYPKLLEKLREKLKNELPEKARVIVVTWGFEHPFGKPCFEKIIPWRPQPFKIFVFIKEGIIIDNENFL